ncbi:hypothetical protein BKA58DRAFT_404796 [Alternaria rosae]|uniref:uncharacterized protein n=1 Tax=Alternaria rosae TaxID=1187941 RepID=UPI001E8DB87B|nr:uncharacterized protein BKA58DRAFT_404796 [Alternaria rosae]KAH6865012.1 hypothetical protein BKA58DRAFT_404796 [Alternaria rosae]
MNEDFTYLFAIVRNTLLRQRSHCEGERREEVKADLTLPRPIKLFPLFSYCLSSHHLAPSYATCTSERDGYRTNSADPSSGNAMAWREAPGIVQPNARFTLYALELTNGHFPGLIQIVIPKPPSAGSITPSSSHSDNANSEHLHPLQSTNTTHLKRKHPGNDANLPPKRTKEADTATEVPRTPDQTVEPVYIELENPPADTSEFLK